MGRKRSSLSVLNPRQTLWPSVSSVMNWNAIRDLCYWTAAALKHSILLVDKHRRRYFNVALCFKSAQVKHLVISVRLVVLISPPGHLHPPVQARPNHVTGTRHTLSSSSALPFKTPPPAETYIHLHQVSGEHDLLNPSYILTTIFVTFLISYAFFFCQCTLYVKAFIVPSMCSTTSYTSLLMRDRGCGDVIGNKMCLSQKLHWIKFIKWVGMSSWHFWHGDAQPIRTSCSAYFVLAP